MRPESLPPQNLHAHAAVWAVRAVLPVLAAEIHAKGRGALGADLGTLQASRPRSGVSGSREGDRIANAIINAETSSNRPYVERLRGIADTVIWVMTKKLGLTAVHGLETNLDTLTGMAPTTPPALAFEVSLWLSDEDRRTRDLLREPPDRRLQPDPPCPACGLATLAIRTSPPVRERPVVCTAHCLCTGPGCGCGMTCPSQGVPHIWSPAEYGARPAQRGVAA